MCIRDRFERLERYVEFAASLGWFSRIQIQTNGRRLADPDYLRRLIDAGVNEFFVSLHGPEPVHDEITGRPGAFGEVMAALENLSRHPGVGTITNTVWTRLNSDHAAALLSRIARLPFIREMHLWNFFPMAADRSQELVESLPTLLAHLPAMAEAAAAQGKPLVLKAFPQCLPVPAGAHLDSEFPLTLIPDVFWRALGQCGFGGCAHRGQCEDQKCWGLSNAYRERYGEEPALLHPLTRQANRSPESA